MTRIRHDEDITSLSGFRTNAAAVVEKARRTGRPVVLTQHGVGAAVLMDVRAYERLLDELEMLRDMAVAEAEIETGEAVDHEEAVARLRSLTRR